MATNQSIGFQYSVQQQNSVQHSIDNNTERTVYQNTSLDFSIRSPRTTEATIPTTKETPKHSTEDSSCAVFHHGHTVLHEFRRCCVDGSSKLFASGDQCRSFPVQTARYAVAPMPAREDLRMARLRGRGVLIDCWSSGGNPSHSFMGLAQAAILADWLNRTGGPPLRWVLTRGCSMHTGSAASAALQNALDALLFGTGLASPHHVPLWDLPLRAEGMACFEHGVAAPAYAGFPPARWRPLLLGRLRLLIGVARPPPAARGPCAGAGVVRVGVYYRSGTADVNRLRRMCNLDAALAALAGLVGQDNVAAFTSNESMSLASQVELFDRFDVLVGPHGSQWAMSWFAERPRVIIEVQAVFGAFDLRQAMQSRGRGHHFLISSGHELYQNECTGVEEEVTARARRMCAPQNFDGTLMLCDDAGRLPACAGVPRCRPERPEDWRQLLAFKYQSTRVNVTALREHVATAIALINLPPCKDRDGWD